MINRINAIKKIYLLFRRDNEKAIILYNVAYLVDKIL